MKNFLLLALLCLQFSCVEKPKSNAGKDFVDRIIDLSTENPQNRYIELPDLYDTPVQYIPEDKDDSSLLVEKLLLKGFKESGRKRSNFPLVDKQMLLFTLQNAECRCEVAKIYYQTAFVGQYSRTERIKCEKID